MKIAIYHNLPSGGGKRALFEFARRLAERHTLDVFSLSSANHTFCDVRPFCRQHNVYPFSASLLARSPFGRVNPLIRVADLARLRRLEASIAASIDAAGYDAAFIHNCQFGQSPGLLSFLSTPSLYLCAEPPRQLYEPAPPRPYAEPSRLRRLADRVDPLPEAYRSRLKHWDRENTRKASVVVANSYYSRETLYRVYGVNARVCYLGVDTQRFRPLPAPRERFVLSVGELRPDKGFDFLLRSLARIEPARRPRLVLVSNATITPERLFLEQLAHDLGVVVEFRSLVSDEELTLLYNQAALTVYAPVLEPFGFVALESMACGTPVVGVREAGVRESVTDGKTGLLTERDPRQFACAVLRLLEDESLRSAYGADARSDVEARWHWDRSVDNIDHVLAELCNTTHE
jgi:glycosyltransferase involved in cell wall biosynthesis